MINKKVYTSDPFAKFLCGKLLYKFDINPLKFAFISAFLMATMYIIAATLSQSFVLPGSKKGLFEDWNSWIWILIYNPIVLGFYYWLSTNNIVEKLSYNFYEKNITQNKDDRQINDLLKFYKHPLPKFMARAISLIYGFLFYQSRVRLQGWTGTAFMPRISATIIGIIVMYVIIMEANILIINLRGIRKLVQAEKLKINPWHPDKCGGLKPITEYIITATYLVGLIWFMLFLSIYQYYKENLIEQFWYMLSIIPILILFSSTCFMWTLYAVHKEMEKSKQEFLDPFAKELHKNFLNINNLIISAFPNEQEQNKVGELGKIVQKEMKVILNLDLSYKSMVNNYSTWPFDINSIKVWLVTIIIPLSIPIVSAFFKTMAEMVSKP